MQQQCVNSSSVTRYVFLLKTMTTYYDSPCPRGRTFVICLLLFIKSIFCKKRHKITEILEKTCRFWITKRGLKCCQYFQINLCIKIGKHFAKNKKKRPSTAQAYDPNYYLPSPIAPTSFTTTFLSEIWGQINREKNLHSSFCRRLKLSRY